MDLKLNILKKGLATTAEVINEEYTLNYGHIFRGKSAYQQAVDGGFVGSEGEFNEELANINKPIEISYDRARDLLDKGANEHFAKIYETLLNNKNRPVVVLHEGNKSKTYAISTSLLNYKHFIRVNASISTVGYIIGSGREVVQVYTYSINICPDGAITLAEWEVRELVDKNAVVDNLVTADENSVLSARQGTVLNDSKVGAIELDEETGEYVLYSNSAISRSTRNEIGRIGAVRGLEPITYAELRALKSEGKLVQGMRYRITDYVTTTAQSYTQSTEHPFDVIVTALDAHTLSEDALAIQHEGDTYFANSNLAAWELKYNFDNDTTKYKWAKAWVEEKPQSWTANTGVIESRNDNGVSTNYTVANVGGKQVYLYKPASVDYLRDKTFYTMEGEVVDYITDVSELAIGTTVNPFEHQYEMYDYDVLFVHRATGQVVGTAHIYEDWGEDDDGYYSIEIEHNDNSYYVQCKSSEPITINGVTYYEWKADEEDNPASDYVGEKIVINPGTRVDYNGSVDNFYYAFESILPQKNIAVEYMYGDGVLYRSDDLNDEVIYQKYVAPVVGSKGVIYRLTDEFNNSLPFDFKNIQFKLNNVYCYTFDNNGKDTSLSGTISENYFEGYSRGSTLGGCIFQSPNVHHNIIRSPFYENGGSYCKTDFYGNEIIATGKTTGAMRGFRMQVDGSITFCKFLHNGSNASSSYCRLSVSAESTLLNTLLTLYASTPNITINGIIYNSNIIGYGGSNTINIGRMGWCDVKLGSSCSIVCTNSQGNTTGAFMGSKFNLASFDTITLTMKTDETSDNTRAYRINADIKATTTVDINALQAHILYNIAPNSNGVVKVWCAADLVQ